MKPEIKLIPNNDLDALPLVPTKWEPQTPIEKWIAQFPYEAIIDGQELNLGFRCGEMDEPKDNKVFARRLRIRISYMEWQVNTKVLIEDLQTVDVKGKPFIFPKGTFFIADLDTPKELLIISLDSRAKYYFNTDTAEGVSAMAKFQ